MILVIDEVDAADQISRSVASLYWRADTVLLIGRAPKPELVPAGLTLPAVPTQLVDLPVDSPRNESQVSRLQLVAFFERAAPRISAVGWGVVLLQRWPNDLESRASVLRPPSSIDLPALSTLWLPVSSRFDPKQRRWRVGVVNPHARLDPDAPAARALTDTYQPPRFELQATQKDAIRTRFQNILHWPARQSFVGLSSDANAKASMHNLRRTMLHSRGFAASELPMPNSAAMVDMLVRRGCFGLDDVIDEPDIAIDAAATELLGRWANRPTPPDDHPTLTGEEPA